MVDGTFCSCMGGEVDKPQIKIDFLHTDQSKCFLPNITVHLYNVSQYYMTNTGTSDHEMSLLMGVHHRM